MSALENIGRLAIIAHLRRAEYNSILHAGVWKGDREHWRKFRAAQSDMNVAKRTLDDAIKALSEEDLGLTKIESK